MNERPVSTLAQFCADHDLSRTTLHYLEKAGKGPKLMRVGRRVFVTKEAQAEWRRRMEDETAAAEAHTTPQPTPTRRAPPPPKLPAKKKRAPRRVPKVQATAAL